MTGRSTELEARFREAADLAAQSPRSAQHQLASLVQEATPTDPGVAGQAAYLLARLAVVGAQPLQALEWIDQAQRLFLAADDDLAASRTQLGKINVLDELGRHREAVEVGSSLIEDLRGRLGSDRSADEQTQWMLAGAAENTGASNGFLGRHEAALDLYDQAIELYERIGEPVDEARVSANRGVELLELGHHAEAITLLNEAASTFEQAADDLAVARCLAYAAKAHAIGGHYGAAVETLAAADAKLDDLEQSHDHLRLSLVWAEVYSALNLQYEALARCNELIPAFEAAAMTRDAGAAQLVKATVLGHAGATQQAIEACTAAEDRFEQVGLPALTARCWLLRSELVDPDVGLPLAREAYEILSSAGHAAEAAEAAIRCVELGGGGQDLEHAADLVVAHGLDSLAWRVDYILGRWAEEAGAEQDATDHYRRALDSLRDLRSRIGAEAIRIPFMGRRRHVQEALVFLLLRLGDVEGAAEVTEAERAETLVTQLEERVPLEVEDRPRAGPSSTTMTYQRLDNEIVCFITPAGRTEPELVRTKLTVADTEELLRKLDAQWRRLEDPRLSAHRETLQRSTERLLQDLFLGLFQPAEIHIDEGDRIVVAPVGPLANVPFHALHNGLEYLVDRYEFSMTPSVTVANRPVVRRSSGHTLVVGVPDDSMPQAEREAEAVAELTGGQLLTGPRATVDAVRAEAERAEVVHLATHGTFRADNPWFSAIRLADRWVSAIDIQRWDLGGALVVLAACRSGQQAGLGGGDELLGIPRACLAAGAAGIVVNLWRVDDLESVGLMTSFHQNLRIEPPARALRLAQQAALARTPHPYHWAPSVLYGARPEPPILNRSQEEPSR